MKKLTLLPLFVGLVLAGCSRTSTDTQKISSNDKPEPTNSTYDEKAAAAQNEANDHTQIVAASASAPAANKDAIADTPRDASTPSPMMTNSSPTASTAQTSTEPLGPSTPVAPVADQTEVKRTTTALNPADKAESAKKSDLSTRLAEWKLTPTDIKSEFEASGSVTRSRFLGAGEPTGPMDAALITLVEGKLKSNADTSALKIDVSADQGTVTLKGSAQSLDQIGKAVAIALDTDGVVQTVSKIKLATAP